MRRRIAGLPALPVAGVALALAATAGGVALASGALSGGCRGLVTVTVAADPAPAAAVNTVAAAYDRSRPSINGTCVTVRVTPTPSPSVLSALNAGWPETTAGVAPDVWIPDSTDWWAMARGNPTAARLLTAQPVTIATTRVVLALPTPMATALAASRLPVSWSLIQDSATNTRFWSQLGHPAWGGLRVEFADPAASSASLHAVLSIAAVRANITPPAFTPASFQTNRVVQLGVLSMERDAAAVTRDNPGLLADMRAAGTQLARAPIVPLQEASLVSYNHMAAGTDPAGQPYTALYPTGGVTPVDVPFIPVAAGRDPLHQRATTAFLTRLRSPAGQTALENAGYRSLTGAATALGPATGTRPDATTTRPGPTAGPTLTAAVDFFGHIHRRGASLALVDVSGSMMETVPGTNPPQSKLDIAANALVTALPLFAPDSEAGLWEFATHLPGDQDYRQLFPVEPMGDRGHPGPTHRDDLRNLRGDLQPGQDTPLYTATLAAFRERTAHFVTGKVNQVIVLSDGDNDTPDDPHGMTLDQLLAALHASYNPARPVRIITIAYGADADPGPLRAIAAATGARSYQSTNPTDIFNVFVDALTQGT